MVQRLVDDLFPFPLRVVEKKQCIRIGGIPREINPLVLLVRINEREMK